jgi:ABC-type multidrug transport system ATPase subunit
LFLDEPTRGLDPAAARAIRDDIATLGHEERVTIFLTTHYMDEADQLCDRVAFINEGRIVACDTPGRLKLQLGQRRLKVGCRAGGDLWLNLDDPADATRLQGLIAAGEVVTLHSQEATLEDVYLELTGRKLEAR